MTAQVPAWEITATPYVSAIGADTTGRFGGTYRSYWDHPCGEEGAGNALDYWGPGGWGNPLDVGRGDALVAWTLGQHEVQPIRYLIWYGWWWRPGIGWERYYDQADQHGPGIDQHVHVCYE